MRSAKYNFLKISCFFGVLFYFTIDTMADDNPEENDRRAQWNTAQESGAGNVPGQQCINYLNAPKKNGQPRGWNQGTNYKSDGSTFYVAIGLSEIKAPSSSSNFSARSSASQAASSALYSAVRPLSVAAFLICLASLASVTLS